MKIRLGIYKHSKGKLYRVIGIGRNVDDLQEYVVYQALYDDYGIWIRPYDQFIATVEYEGQQVPRFTFISECMTEAPAIR